LRKSYLVYVTFATDWFLEARLVPGTSINSCLKVWLVQVWFLVSMMEQHKSVGDPWWVSGKMPNCSNIIGGSYGMHFIPSHKSRSSLILVL
jgi:hypothetical protein